MFRHLRPGQPMRQRMHRSTASTWPAMAGGLAVLSVLAVLGLLGARAAPDSAWIGLAAVGGRWLLLVGLCLLVGAAFVGTVIFESPPGRLLPLVVVAWVAAAVGLAAVLAGLIPSPPTVGLWRLALVRGVPLVVGGFAMAADLRAGRPSVRGVATVGIAAAAAMLADVGTSHLTELGAAHPPHVEVLVHWLHVVGVGTWLGGLAALLVSLPGEGGEGAARSVRRFSFSAGIGVGVVAATGLVRAVQELGSINNLFTTQFGLMLVMKTVLLIALVGLGAAHRLISLPAAPRSLWPLRRIGGVELAVAAVVLLLAAALVNVPPPS